MTEEVLLDRLIKMTEEIALLKMEKEYLKNKLEKSNIKLNDDDFWRDDKSEKRKVGVKNETKFRR